MRHWNTMGSRCDGFRLPRHAPVKADRASPPPLTVAIRGRAAGRLQRLFEGSAIMPGAGMGERLDGRIRMLTSRRGAEGRRCAPHRRADREPGLMSVRAEHVETLEQRLLSASAILQSAAGPRTGRPAASIDFGSSSGPPLHRSTSIRSARRPPARCSDPLTTTRILLSDRAAIRGSSGRPKISLCSQRYGRPVRRKRGALGSFVKGKFDR